MLVMPAKKVVVLFDLDGVLATRDIAFDLFKANGLGQRYKAESSKIANVVNDGGNFNGQKAYAGQTVNYMMNVALQKGLPITEGEIMKLASEAKLMRGSKSLITALKKNQNVKDIFIISNTYKPAANVIAKRLGIPQKNVFATNLHIEKGRVAFTYPHACGGCHKAKVVDLISALTKTSLNQMVAVGDSITDIGMMEKVVKGGGLGIAFNANNDLLKKKPNVIYAGRSLKPAYGLVNTFATKGHLGIKKIVTRNIRLRKAVGIPMTMIGRPFLFRSGVKNAKAAKKSSLYRAKVRTKKIARLR